MHIFIKQMDKHLSKEGLSPGLQMTPPSSLACPLSRNVSATWSAQYYINYAAQY